MGHIIGNIFGIVTLVLFFRWYKGQKFRWIHFIVDVIGAGIIIFIGNILGDYLSKNIHISIPFYSRIPDEVKNWFGAILIFIGCCVLSIKSWIHFNEQKRNKNSKSS
jgi:uncharacterized membrane protein YfcA